MHRSSPPHQHASRFKQVILCDGCEREYHFGCVGIVVPPKGDFFCFKCKGTKGGGTSNGEGVGGTARKRSSSSGGAGAANKVGWFSGVSNGHHQDRRNGSHGGASGTGPLSSNGGGGGGGSSTGGGAGAHNVERIDPRLLREARKRDMIWRRRMDEDDELTVEYLGWD